MLLSKNGENLKKLTLNRHARDCPSFLAAWRPWREKNQAAQRAGRSLGVHAKGRRREEDGRSFSSYAPFKKRRKAKEVDAESTCARTRKRAQHTVAKAECGWGDMCTCNAMARTYHKQIPVGQGVCLGDCVLVTGSEEGA
jgi:hypothetical protein